MDKKLLSEFWQEALDMVTEAIRITKAANLHNDQDMLNYIDRINELSVLF